MKMETVNVDQFGWQPKAIKANESNLPISHNGATLHGNDRFTLFGIPQQSNWFANFYFWCNWIHTAISANRLNAILHWCTIFGSAFSRRTIHNLLGAWCGFCVALDYAAQWAAAASRFCLGWLEGAKRTCRTGHIRSYAVACNVSYWFRHRPHMCKCGMDGMRASMIYDLCGLLLCMDAIWEIVVFITNAWKLGLICGSIVWTKRRCGEKKRQIMLFFVRTKPPRKKANTKKNRNKTMIMCILPSSVRDTLADDVIFILFSVWFVILAKTPIFELIWSWTWS